MSDSPAAWCPTGLCSLASVIYFILATSEREMIESSNICTYLLMISNSNNLQIIVSI